MVDVGTATVFQITLPKEEHILRVRRDEKDLVNYCVFNVLDQSLLRVRHYEKALAHKDVVYFIEVPKGNHREFVAVLASFFSQIVGAT